MKDISLSDQFKSSIDKFSNKFTIDCLDGYYKDGGFKASLNINIPLRLTQKSFSWGNAKGEIIGNKLYIQGYLNDIETMLSMIV